MKLEVFIKKQLANFPLQVSFQTDGETLAFLGTSGSGKSMMLKCIAGRIAVMDCGIELPLSAVEPLQGDPHKVRYAAVRAENLRQAERRDGAILSAKVIRTIEELLTKLLIVQGRGSSPLYWRVKKDRIFMDGDIVSLKFSPADLALLCDGR